MPEQPGAADSPPPVASAAPASAASPLKIPLSDEARGGWRRRLDASAKMADERADVWKELVAIYMGKVLGNRPTEDSAIIPLEFAYVELKKSQLAFQVPEVSLKPKRPGLESAVVVFQDALNHELGPEGANTDALLEEILTDVLLCGIGASVISYYADIRTKDVPVMGPPPLDPMTGGPAVDPATGQPAPPQPVVDPMTGQPQTQPEQYVADECFEWNRLSPELLRVPVEFEGSDFDTAAWMGRRFRMDVSTAISRYKLPPDFQPTVTSPRDTLSSDEGPDREVTTREVEGDEIWYQTQVFDPKAKALRGALRRLVFVDNHPAAVVHEDSPYQYLDTTDGKLKGMRGYPIHVLTLRYLPGAAYPVSDVEITRPIADEERAFRTQQMRFRDRSMPFVGVDRTRMSPDDKKKMELGQWLPNRVQGFDGPVHEQVGIIALGNYPRENVEFGRICRRDYELGWSMTGTQTAQTSEGEPATATEINSADQATRTRLGREQALFLKWWTKGASKYASLLLQFVDEPRYAEITGPDGAKALQAWNRTTAGGVDAEYAFTARPDAALRMDAEAQFKQEMTIYTQMGNDPNFNRAAYMKKMLSKRGYDAAQFVVDQLPEKGPEPPKIALSVKGEDFSLASPQMPIIIAVMEQLGLKIPPEAIQNAQQLVQQIAGMTMALQAQQAMAAPPADDAHGGVTTPVQPIDKHTADHGMQGSETPVM